MSNIVAERYFQRARDIRKQAQFIADPEAKRSALEASKRLERQGAKRMNRIGKPVHRKAPAPKGP